MDRIRLLKGLDALLGAPLARLLPRPATGTPPPIAPGTVAVLRPGGIGDAVLLAPTLHRLRRAFPAAVLTVLAEKRNHGVFALVPGVDQVRRYDHPADLAAFLRRPYDLVIDSEQSHYLTAVMSRACRTAMRIGFATNHRCRLYDHGVPYRQHDYEVVSFLRLLAPLGLPGPDSPPAGPFLQVPAEARQSAATRLAPLAGRSPVAIFPGASVNQRRWGADRFRRVAETLSRQGLGIVVVGGPGDRAAGETITAGLPAAVNLAGRTTLAETAGVLHRCRLLVSADSGVLHLAVGLDVPTVSLFGPGIEAKWGPRGPGHRIINKRLACSPCTRFGTTPPCPRDVACMKAITPEEVTAAALELLQETDSGRD